eukprot:TRINITY_DN28434_c0_g1_i1.p1 TRINITY_DN28434_c0_g1~~TRINITY_DN28434_c0_g1_i1.p1  ORF type:complete len:327 (+),score=61.79 TRINITY_DN28434_c0_g1_i1:62-982(+)
MDFSPHYVNEMEQFHRLMKEKEKLGTTRTELKPLDIRPIAPTDRRDMSPDRGKEVRFDLENRAEAKRREEEAKEIELLQNHYLKTTEPATMNGINLFDTTEVSTYVREMLNPIVYGNRPSAPLPVHHSPYPRPPDKSTSRTTSLLPPEVEAQLQRLQAERDHQKHEADLLTNKLIASEQVLGHLNAEAAERRSQQFDNPNMSSNTPQEVAQLIDRLDAINKSSENDIHSAREETALLKQQLATLQAEYTALQESKQSVLQYAPPGILQSGSGGLPYHNAAVLPPPIEATALPMLRNRVQDLVSHRL